MKAQVDVIFLIVIAFALIIALFTVDIVWNGLTSNSAFQALTNATPTGKLAVKSTTNAISLLNNSIIVLFFFGAFVSIISAAFTDASPVFVLPAIIVLPIEIIFSFIFHDIFLQVISNSSFAAVAAQYNYIVIFMQYLPVISFIVSIIIIMFTFTK